MCNSVFYCTITPFFTPDYYTIINDYKLCKALMKGKTGTLNGDKPSKIHIVTTSPFYRSAHYG